MRPKLIFILFCLLAASTLSGQIISPPGGTVFTIGQQATICWAQPYTGATLFLSYYGYAWDIFGSTTQSGAGCYTFTPTQAGTIYAELQSDVCCYTTNFYYQTFQSVAGSGGTNTDATSMGNTIISQPATPDDYDTSEDQTTLTPPNGTQLYVGTPVQFCWPGPSTGYTIDSISAGSTWLGATDEGYFWTQSGVTCIQFTPTVAGQMYVQAVLYTPGYTQSITLTAQYPVGYNQNAPAVPQMTKKVETSQGTVEIPRGDIVNIGNLRYQFSGSGPYVYTYTLDNTDVDLISLGDSSNIDVDANLRLIKDLRGYNDQVPGNWGGSSGGWYAMKDPARGPNAQYSVTSKKLPGLMPIFFQGDIGMRAAWNGGDLPALPMGTSKDNQKIAEAADIYGNSVQRFVIGPVFAPGISRAEVLARVKTWVSQFGFSFLEPLLEGHGLADLQPSNQLEQDIRDCLARVL